MYTVNELHEALITLIAEGQGEYEVKACDQRVGFFEIDSLWVKHDEIKKEHCVILESEFV